MNPCTRAPRKFGHFRVTQLFPLPRERPQYNLPHKHKPMKQIGPCIFRNLKVTPYLNGWPGPAGKSLAISLMMAGRLFAADPPTPSLGLYPGVMIDGVVGKTYTIQSANNVNTTNWTTVTNLTLTQGHEQIGRAS